METKLCLDCNESLYGRSDKLFCNDACRNNYHNQKLTRRSLITKKINRRLSKNYSILEKLAPRPGILHSENTLVSLGFDFDYHTQVLKVEEDSMVYFCYDIAYRRLENSMLELYPIVVSSPMNPDNGPVSLIMNTHLYNEESPMPRAS
jgi:hypothetical protein